jgi:hypothetical protein
VTGEGHVNADAFPRSSGYVAFFRAVMVDLCDGSRTLHYLLYQSVDCLPELLVISISLFIADYNWQSTKWWSHKKSRVIDGDWRRCAKGRQCAPVDVDSQK